jgi:toxin-antitoxin system PIN domain toxin
LIALDTNVLVYADREELAHHKTALSTLRRMAEGRQAWGLPVFCMGEFLRVVTHPKLFRPPTPGGEATQALAQLLESPSARVLAPGESYWPILRELMLDADVSGNHVFDAQIAAVCLEHGATLLTADRDFARFASLKVIYLGAP